MKSPVFCCNRVRKMQDRSCSDCVTVKWEEEKWQCQQSSSQHCGADRLLTQLVLHLSLFDIIPVNQLIPRASIQLVFRVLQMKFPADFRVNKRGKEKERRRMILNKIQWVIRSRDISSKQRDTHAYGLHAVERGSRRAGIFTSIEFLAEENKIFSASWCDVILHRHHHPTHLFRSFISVLERSFTTNNLSQIATASILHCVACCCEPNKTVFELLIIFILHLGNPQHLGEEKCFSTIDWIQQSSRRRVNAIDWKKSSSAEPLGGD